MGPHHTSSERPPLATHEEQSAVQAQSADAFYHYRVLSSMPLQHYRPSCQLVSLSTRYQQQPHLLQTCQESVPILVLQLGTLSSEILLFKLTINS